MGKGTKAGLWITGVLVGLGVLWSVVMAGATGGGHWY